MRRYQRLYEDLLIEAGLATYEKNKDNIVKNPNKKQISELLNKVPEGFLKTLRAILYNDLYVWSAPDLLHEAVMEHNNIDHNAATLEFDFSESPIRISLSATNDKINKLAQLPVEKQTELVMTNPRIEAIFGKLDPNTNQTSGTYKAKFS